MSFTSIWIKQRREKSSERKRGKNKFIAHVQKWKFMWNREERKKSIKKYKKRLCIKPALKLHNEFNPLIDMRKIDLIYYLNTVT